jgi:cell division protein FtsQ
MWVVGTVALISSLAVALIAAANSPWLDVEEVVVTGVDRADPDDIVAAAGISEGQPLVDVHLDQATEAVEQVPWVDMAAVDRDWRGTVTIDVIERSALVTVPTTAGGHLLADTTGRQLEEVAVPAQGLLPVTGVEVTAEPGQGLPPDAMMAVNLAQALPADLAGAADAVSVSDGVLVLELSGGGAIEFGDDRLLEDKLVAVETVLTRVDLTCLGSIRVGVPSKPTISRISNPGSDSPEGEEPSGNRGGC